MNIGKAIRKARNSKKVSQLTLGLAIGNDSAYISRIENNKREPTIKTVVRIAEALEMKPIDLFELIFNEEK